MNPNHFTETLLPLYTILQPKFRERMGELLKSVNDEYICPKGIGITNRSICSSKCKQHDEYCYKNPFVFIPRTIDDSSEEARKRSLWGMVDWSRFDSISNEAGVFTVRDWINDDPAILIKGATPTEAILRALVAQWGVEVE